MTTDPNQLSRRERQIMEVIYSRGRATAAIKNRNSDRYPGRTGEHSAHCGRDQLGREERG